MNSHKRSVFEASVCRYARTQIFAFAGGAIDLPADAFRKQVVTDTSGLEHKTGPDYTVLDYGDNLPKPPPDMEIDAEGIRATLSFGGVPAKTFVPWGNVFMITLPEEGFASTWAVRAKDLEGASETGTAKTTRPKLALV